MGTESKCLPGKVCCVCSYTADRQQARCHAAFCEAAFLCSILPAQQMSRQWPLGVETGVNFGGGPYRVQVPFNLSNNRKAGISDFKGTHYCNIREYYEVKD